MAAAVRIRGIRATPPGMVTVVVVVRSENLPPFTIDVRVSDHGSEAANREQARAALQRFSVAFAEALQQPLEFEEPKSPSAP